MTRNKLTANNTRNYNPEIKETTSQERGMLSMSLGKTIHIRTRQKCKVPGCKEKFLHKEGRGLICPNHEFSFANQFYIEWWWKGERFILHGFDSYRQVYDKAISIRHEIESYKFNSENYKGTSKVKNKYQFSYVYEEWLKDRKKEVERNILAPSYYEKLNQYKKDFIGYFKDEDIRTIKSYDIKKFENNLPLSLSLKTLKNKLMALRKFFQELYDMDFINEMPKFSKIKTQEPEWSWIEENVQIKILDKIPQKDKPIFEFLFATGLRPAEVRALHWKNIFKDADTPYIDIRAGFSKNIYREITKTKNQWQIPITSKIDKILKNTTRRLGCEWVFWYLIGNTKVVPYGEKKLRAVWHKACKEAGVDAIKLYHGTRHSFASQWVNSGKSIDGAGYMMGHKSPQTTKRYAHLDKLKAIKKMMEG
jgi:integrase